MEMPQGIQTSLLSKVIPLVNPFPASLPCKAAVQKMVSGTNRCPSRALLL